MRSPAALGGAHRADRKHAGEQANRHVDYSFADASPASDILLRHGLARRDEQAAELIDRIVYQAEGAALAHRHRDLQGFLYWAYGLFQDVRTLAPIAREMRDVQEGRP